MNLNTSIALFCIIGFMLSTNGEWVEGKSAGGSRNDLDLFATNPQYVLTLKEAGK